MRRLNLCKCACLLSAALVAGVSFRTLAQRQLTTPDLPKAWGTPAADVPPMLEGDGSVDARWWASFGLPELDSLIAAGLDYNYDVAQAMRRLEMARLAVDKARSAYYPTVGISGAWQLEREAGAIEGKRYPSVDSRHWALAADARWEIDVFGRVRAAVKESKARRSASRTELAAMQVSVAAEIASDYFQLVTLRQQRDITRSHILNQDSILTKVEARYEAGLVSGLDVAQSKTVFYSTQASLPALDSEIASLTNALVVLTGRMPLVAPPPDAAIALPDPAALPLPLLPPADLLRRRPDIAQAEAVLEADAAAVGLAKKDFLPTLAIEASAGTYARDASRLFSSNSWGWSVAPTISWTVFDGFARKVAVAEARQQLEADVDAYNLAVTNAVAEVDNALASWRSAIDQEHFYTLTFEQASRYYDGIVREYLSGLADYSDVATAQIDLLEFANTLAGCRGQALQALVAVYKAMGGGWQENLHQ